MAKNVFITIMLVVSLNFVFGQDTSQMQPQQKEQALKNHANSIDPNQTTNKVLLQMSMPGMTTARFDQIWDELRRAGLAHPKGLIYHAAGPKGNNMIIVDVWDSIESFHKFRETLLPILSKYGLPKIEPELTPVYLEYNSLDQKQ